MPKNYLSIKLSSAKSRNLLGASLSFRGKFGSRRGFRSRRGEGPVGARVVKSGGVGLYGRPLSVPVEAGLYGRSLGDCVARFRGTVWPARSP